MQFTHRKLDNGLTIVAEVRPTAASMAAGFFVRSGSRDEPPELAGVSHFLEHMTFKGTARRTALDVNREFDELGANYNAFTSEENTVYYGAVLPEFQDRLMDLLCDILRPSLRQEDFDVEKGVILDEIARYEDMPRYRLYELLMGEYFLPHSLGHSVLGTAESVGAMRRDQMQAYFSRRYSPGNVTLVGVGNVDFDALVGKAAEQCSGWQPCDVTRDTSPPPPAARRKVHTDPNVAREQIGLASPAPSSQGDERYAATLAATVLGDVTGSRLFYALVDPALADEASVVYDALDGSGVFLTFISAGPEQASEALRIARRELAGFLDDGPTDAELLAAKNKIASGATLKGEVPMGRLTAVGYDWVYRGEYVPLADQIEALFAVTRQEVLEMARRYDLSSATVVALGPLEQL
ncbi:MAG TPA: pitrilysin family protein [Phycisphaerae bacterium]|nr:pitrilysin family protein [Phycisphaerae bacterium]